MILHVQWRKVISPLAVAGKGATDDTDEFENDDNGKKKKENETWLKVIMLMLIMVIKTAKRQARPSPCLLEILYSKHSPARACKK